MIGRALALHTECSSYGKQLKLSLVVRMMNMKLFKMTALVTLMFAAAAQSAFAVGRVTSVEGMTAESFKCEKLAAQEIKRQTASADLRETDRKVEREETGTVKSSM
jgi:hypothetical protein